MLWKQRNKPCEIVFSGSYTCTLLFLLSGAANLCSALVRLQEQRPISLKVMSTLQFYKCQKKKKKIKVTFSHGHNEVPWALESPPGASERMPAACHFYSEILNVDAGNCSFTCAFIFMFVLCLCCVFFAARVSLDVAGGGSSLLAELRLPRASALSGAERGLQPRRLQCGARA